MTGHGRGTAEAAGRRVTVEIRAVNHRYFELKLRTATLDARVEESVTQTIRKRAERGAFAVSVRDEGATTRAVGFRIDLDGARAVHGSLEELRRNLGIAEPVALALVLAQPGVVTSAEALGSDVDATLAALAPALDAALDELIAMRRREGDALARDLFGRLDRLDQLAAEIRGYAIDAPAEFRRRLSERLTKLMAPGTPVAIDEGRLALEVAVLADRTDVTEELVRLAAHLAAIRAHVAEDVPVGRRLDFLVQELGREVNTIGSKSQSSEIARRVVEAKAELEKIREQVQNVE